MMKTINSTIGGAPLKFTNNNRLSPVNSTGSVSFRCHVAEPAIKRSSHYETLRLKSNATANEIKTAYRNLAKIYHPDSLLNQYDDRKFIDIHNAYVTLYNPDERLMYDLKMNSGLARRSETYNTVAGKRRESYTSRRWETDQCW